MPFNAYYMRINIGALQSLIIRDGKAVNLIAKRTPSDLRMYGMASDPRLVSLSLWVSEGEENLS